VNIADNKILPGFFIHLKHVAGGLTSCRYTGTPQKPNTAHFHDDPARHFPSPRGVPRNLFFLSATLLRHTVHLCGNAVMFVRHNSLFVADLTSLESRRDQLSRSLLKISVSHPLTSIIYVPIHVVHLSYLGSEQPHDVNIMCLSPSPCGTGTQLPVNSRMSTAPLPPTHS